MSETAFETIQQVINVFLRAPFVRSVLVCDINGDIAAGGGVYSDKERELIRGMASSMFPPTRRMAEKSGNMNEAQSLSLPDENVHLLIFRLALQYYLVVFFFKPQDPYKPPGSAVKTCDLIRSILQSPKQGESLSTLSADLEKEIGLERHIHSNKKEMGTRPNPYDLTYLEGQRKQVVTIAQDILSGKKGVIEGARLLARLGPTVTRDDRDPDFLPFVAIDTETDGLPLGKERELWANSALLEKDKEIQREEEFQREKVFAACRIIIERFSGNI